MLHLSRCLFVCLLSIWIWRADLAEAKTTSGKFRLSGLNTEYVLGSFAVSPRKMGTLKVEFKSKEPYDQNKDLYVRLIRDDKWSEFQKAPSCTEKVPFSLRNEQVTTKLVRGRYEAEVAMELNNHKDDSPHYYYFVITDCSLEFYMHDDSIPKMTYKLTTWSKFFFDYSKIVLAILIIVLIYNFVPSIGIEKTTDLMYQRMRCSWRICIQLRCC